jgi:hypothetical protein
MLHLKLSDTQKGLASMAAGLLLVFYALGLIGDTLIFILAIALFAYGFIRAGMPEYIRRISKKN